MSKRKSSDFVSLIKPCAAAIYSTEWRDELEAMRSKLQELWEGESAETEAHDTLEELTQLFAIFNWQAPDLTSKKDICKWIGGLSWENFYDDETGKPYSLGGMYYNKLQWIIEGDNAAEKETVEFAKLMVDTLPKFLDAVEVFASKK